MYCQSFMLFADDTDAFVYGTRTDELEILVNKVMKNVQMWLEDNHLRMNIKKTNYIVFKSH